MRRSPRTEVTKLDDYRIEIVGADPTSLDDLVHVLLTVSWSAFLGVIAVVYVALNALFGLAYLAVGGVEGVRGFADAFYFSVQTMGTAPCSRRLTLRTCSWCSSRSPGSSSPPSPRGSSS